MTFRRLLPQLLLFWLCSHAYGDNTSSPTKPFTFTSGNLIKSSEVNSDFDTLYTGLANVGTANLLSASVTNAKLAASAVGLSNIVSGAFTADATGRGKFANGFMTNALMAADSIASSNIIDGTIVAADINASANILGTQLATRTVAFSNIASAGVPRATSNVLVVFTSATSITVTADQIIAVDGSGNYLAINGLSVIVSLGSTGANGLESGSAAANTTYYLYAIAGSGQADAGVLSTSSTSPTLPASYTNYKKIGEYRLNASAQFPAFIQRGQRLMYRDPQLVVVITAGSDTGAYTSTTAQAVAAANGTGSRPVPATAKFINILVNAIATTGSGTASFVLESGASSNGNGTGIYYGKMTTIGSIVTSVSAGPPAAAGSTSAMAFGSIFCEMPLESSQVIFQVPDLPDGVAASAGVAYSFYITGYEVAF